MGFYVNPGNCDFSFSLKSPIYVDKSPLINILNKRVDTEGSRICVSRPRRFGKSIAANMIAAYYGSNCDSRAMFEGLKLSETEGWDENLNKYNVIKIDVQAILTRCGGKGNVAAKITKEVKEELSIEFPDVPITARMTLSEAMMKVYARHQKGFVLIMDEYDVLIRTSAPKKSFDPFLILLNDLFKSSDMRRVIRLAYLTGILPIVRDRIQSKLNNFDEFTMLSPGDMAPYMGFSKEEVADLCREHDMDLGQCLEWYDGYQLDTQTEVTAPYSVVKAMEKRRFESHWTKTSSFESLKDYINFDFDGIKADVCRLMGGEKISVNINTFLNTLTCFNTKHDIFTYLVHLGYLSYNSDTRLVCIPNKEIMQEWESSVMTSKKYKFIWDMIDDSRRLLEATIDGDEKAVSDALNKSHLYTTSALTYNNEASLQSAIGIAYFYAYDDYKIVKELPAGRGFADMAFIPKHPGATPIIVELKWNKSTALALRQAAAKRYADALKDFGAKEVIVAAVTYDQESGEHKCEIKTEKCQGVR